VLRGPAPAWADRAIASLVVSVFVLAWWTFAFPLSYCDSPGWAPGYLAHLIGREQVVMPVRGAVVPAWFQLWGALSIASGFGNLIGAVQGLLLASTVLGCLGFLRRGATVAELLLLPAFALSGLRHAVYGQTLLSEALAVPLVVAAGLWILREGTPSWRSSTLIGAASGLAASIRLENLLLLAFAVARIAFEGRPARERLVRAGSVLALALAVWGGLSRLAPPEGRAPVAETMVVAEWIRYAEAPRNAPARWLHFELVDRLAVETSAARIAHIYDGLGPTRRLFEAAGAPSWPEVFRLLAYQLTNRPLDVIRDRLETFADLHASAYAAFWPRYRAWSAYYSPYDQVFARWDLAHFQEQRSSCPHFARAQAYRFGREPIRSPWAFEALKRLHRAGEGYARWILRPLLWAALPLCAWVLLRGSGGRRYAWLSAFLFASLALRAALVCADERYQLPLDLLTLGWLALTLRHAFERGAAPPPPSGAALS
jgi:hypothetical protein